MNLNRCMLLGTQAWPGLGNQFVHIAKWVYSYRVLKATQMLWTSWVCTTIADGVHILLMLPSLAPIWWHDVIERHPIYSRPSFATNKKNRYGESLPHCQVFLPTRHLQIARLMLRAMGQSCRGCKVFWCETRRFWVECRIYKNTLQKTPCKNFLPTPSPPCRKMNSAPLKATWARRVRLSNWRTLSNSHLHPLDAWTSILWRAPPKQNGFGGLYSYLQY